MGKGQPEGSGGFPDCGEGRYSEKLGYAEWIRYSNFFRAHNNFVEQLPVFIAVLGLAGLFQPDFAVTVGWVTCALRITYTWTYVKNWHHSKWFALFNDILIASLAVTGLVTAVKKVL